MATPTPSGTRSPNRLHPLLALAAVAIVIASLTAVAAITGVLPLASSANSPQGQNQPTQLAANSGVTDSAAPAPLDNLAPAAQSANQSTIPPADQPPPQAPQAPQANAAPAPDLQAQAPTPVKICASTAACRSQQRLRHSAPAAGKLPWLRYHCVDPGSSA